MTTTELTELNTLEVTSQIAIDANSKKAIGLVVLAFANNTQMMLRTNEALDIAAMIVDGCESVMTEASQIQTMLERGDTLEQIKTTLSLIDKMTNGHG
jgi:hypothetical protein